MARGRMLNRKVSTSQKVADLEAEAGPYAVILQHRLVGFLDKNGNCRADPYWLKGEVMPRVAGISPEDCRMFAAAIVKVGLAVLYDVDGMPYLHFPGFRDEQVGLRPERESRDVPVPKGFNEESGTMPDTFRQPSGYLPAEARGPAHGAERGREGEVEVEGEVEDNGSPLTSFATNRGSAPSADAPDEDTENGEATPLPTVRQLVPEVAPLVRRHLWLGKQPPPNVLEVRPDWSEGREADVVRCWIRDEEVVDLEEAKGVIRFARHALDMEEPFSLLFLHDAQGRGRLQEALSYTRKEMAKEAAAAERSGKGGPKRIDPVEVVRGQG